MSVIDRSQTLDELLRKVGAKLDQTITETSAPSDIQVCDWLNEAALLLCRLLPANRLGSLRSMVISDNNTGEFLDLTNSDIVRVVGVKKYGVECTVVDQRTMDLTFTRLPLVGTVRNPSVCVSGESGYVKLQFWPTSSGPVRVKGIRRPTAYHADWLSRDPESDEPIYTYAPDEFSLPVELEQSAIDYALIQGKIQDEEPQQVQLLHQMWASQIGLEMKIEGLGVE